MHLQSRLDLHINPAPGLYQTYTFSQLKLLFYISKNLLGSPSEVFSKGPTPSSTKQHEGGEEGVATLWQDCGKGNHMFGQCHLMD